MDLVDEQVNPETDIHSELTDLFGNELLFLQPCKDCIPTYWIQKEWLRDALNRARQHSYVMLLDLTAIDERSRQYREHQPESDFTVIYHLLSFTHNADLRFKVA